MDAFGLRQLKLHIKIAISEIDRDKDAFAKVQEDLQRHCENLGRLQQILEGEGE